MEREPISPGSSAVTGGNLGCIIGAAVGYHNHIQLTGASAGNELPKQASDDAAFVVRRDDNGHHIAKYGLIAPIVQLSVLLAPRLHQHRLGPVPISGVPAVAARRIVLGVAEVSVHVALHGTSSTTLIGRPSRLPGPASDGPSALTRPGQLPGQLLLGFVHLAILAGLRTARGRLVPLVTAVMAFPPQTTLLSVLSRSYAYATTVPPQTEASQV